MCTDTRNHLDIRRDCAQYHSLSLFLFNISLLYTDSIMFGLLLSVSVEKRLSISVRSYNCSLVGLTNAMAVAVACTYTVLPKAKRIFQL